MGNGISVAMATYNGGEYLAEQLASIAHQEHLPDELVVCDDGSSDGTVGVLREFAAVAPFPVRLEIHAHNRGSTASFGSAIARCRGEIIFLADQDDVWAPQKVGRLAEVLAREPGVGFAFSDARLVDAHRRPLGPNLWHVLPFPPAEQARLNAGKAFDVLLRRNVVAGTTMAFRAEYRRWVLPIPGGWVHDGWLALIISALAKAKAVSEPLVEYRQHAGQQIGARRETLLQKYRRRKRQGPHFYHATAENYAYALARLKPLRSTLPDPSVLDALEQKVAHWRARARMRTLAGWRVPMIAREILRGSYVRYSAGWKSVAEDFVV